MLVLAAALGTGCERQPDPPAPGPETARAAIPSEALFVGGAACGECHEPATVDWTGSHHDLAMQPADASTVLGDFDDAQFTYAGVTSRFFNGDGRFFVRTDGPDGELADFPIAYTFGVEPLQQYLIEFPDGRLQALGIAWDTRPAEAGGQRWFHIYPDERIDADDELHWTRRSHNWNYMCADCHSTGYRKRYDPATDSFASEWTDIDVACEACHGPGSRHVALARAEGLEEDSGLVVSLASPGRHWQRAPGEPTARLVGEPTATSQVEACGRCHARRASLRAEYAHGQPLTDSYLPALLTEPLYFPDGQIRDEVYVYGSFLQSRMHAAGVVCTDCHNPHSVRLKIEGDALCAQCHAPDVFAVADHHRHDADAAPACVDCHMPSRDYMVIDGRRDHSFRVPRPDLAASLGVTDACAACHDDRPDGWSATVVREWLGRDASGYQQFAEVFRAAERGEADAGQRLAALISAGDLSPIAHGTALGHLAAYPTRARIDLLVTSLSDPDPLVRLGALDGLAPLPVPAKRDPLLGRLNDPVRSVRTEAARQLAGVPTEALSPADRDRLREVLAEYVAIQKENADRPEARLNIALVYLAAGEWEIPEQQLSAAIQLHPDFVPAYMNLADLYRGLGREAEAEDVLQAALAVQPDAAATHHAMGLLKVRTEGGANALPWLERAATLAPDNARFQYVWAVALHDTGQRSEAVAVLERAHSTRPADADVLYLLALYQLEAGNTAEALRHAQALQRLQPDNPQAAALVERLAAG
jgi:predicted CXXCH cytochrome family protein